LVCGGHRASYFKPGTDAHFAKNEHPREFRESIVVTTSERLIRGWHVERLELYTLVGC
jgi:dTDP-4-dehydrorhamnose 3,5-epimerase-like enzyme